MNEITKHITLDLSRNSGTRVTFAKQLDHLCRQISVSLTDSGRDYLVPRQAQAIFNVLRPDGESGKFQAEITDDGNILITLTAWMLEKCGEVNCTVALYFEGDMKISTPKFMIEVGEEIVGEQEIEDSESVSLLTSLISDCVEINNAENRRKLNETRRIENEQQRISIETLRTSHENTRMANENQRKANESTRQSQEEARQAQESDRQAKENDRSAVMGDLTEALEHIRDLAFGNVETALSIAYPKGSLYISFEDTSPSVLFGGEWEELEEGRFLMSGALSGNTGGAEKHSHDVSGWAWISGEGDGWGSGNLVWKEKMFVNGEEKLMDRVMGATLPGYAETATCYGTLVDGDTNNVSSIPPYITVHMWRRIA